MFNFFLLPQNSALLKCVKASSSLQREETLPFREAPLPQCGAILIIVLWFLVIVTVMVAALATETRLSAKAVFHNKIGLQTWNDTLQALTAAQLELPINRMQDPPGEEKEVPLSERKSKNYKNYRFDGRVLELAYPIPDTVQVRIYDHAGKINLLRLNKRQLRQILEKRMGEDPEKLDPLLDAWQDWIDRDDLKHVNGAEKEYYETLEPPYEPRNSRLETVEEFLLIKGFAEVFEGVEMDTAFTVLGNLSGGVNPNLATREALMLIPGLDDELINTILTKRREKEFKSYSDFNEFVEPEQLAKFRSWMRLRSTSTFYTIAIQVKPPEDIDKPDTKEETADTEALDEPDETTSPPQEETQRAYMITTQYRGYHQFPKILMVNPYGVLPDTRHERMSSDEDEDEDSSNDAKSTFPFPFK